jgi:hypothetical protein
MPYDRLDIVTLVDAARTCTGYALYHACDGSMALQYNIFPRKSEQLLRTLPSLKLGVNKAFGYSKYYNSSILRDILATQAEYFKSMNE